MTGPDPRIEAAVEVVSREIHVRDWHKGHARRGCALCLGLATRVIQAADAVDPARDAFRGLGPLALELQRAEARRDS